MWDELRILLFFFSFFFLSVGRQEEGLGDLFANLQQPS